MEKLGLFAELNEKPRVTRSGDFRPALDNVPIAPRPVQSRLPVTIGAGSPQSVRDDFYPYYSAYLRPLFKGPMPRPTFEQMISPEGVLIAGGPQEVIDKLMAQREAMGTKRFVGQIDIGGQPVAEVMKGIERFATQVAPVVRRSIS